MPKPTPPSPLPPEVAQLQRPSAEVLHADELSRLVAADASLPKPGGWRLTPRSVLRFILGDAAAGLAPKFVGTQSFLERCIVALATNRGLMLIGEPGTAKSYLSELLAAAISGDSTLTIQGSAGTTEDNIKYSWNYALLLAEGPNEKSLIAAPLYRGMKEGKIVRFEEITRCPIEIQDTLLSILSDRVMSVPELEDERRSLYAKVGFNVIATANTRDRGVNEMSAALKRRFNFETVFPIPDLDTELALVETESAELLRRSGVPVAQRRDVLEVLVTTFRELRAGTGKSGAERLSTVLSTAEAVSVAHAVGLRGWYLRREAGSAEDIVECLAGAAAKDSPDDLAKLRRYLEHDVARRKHLPPWAELHGARLRLPG